MILLATIWQTMVLKVWWFPEYTPAQQVLFDSIKQMVEETYQSFGYAHIETPAVERNEVLFKWWEWASKEIFGLYWMASGAEDLKWYGLNFDLTIPFARYVLDHQNDLAFPFKRYQAQSCRRGERPQRWRFRQFVQCDIDAIWTQNTSDVQHLFYDAELIYLLRSTIEKIRSEYLVDSHITSRINNRNILWGLFTALVGDDQIKKQKLSKLFDSYYKLETDDFYTQIEWVVGKADLWVIKEFVQLSVDDLTEDFVDNKEFASGVQQLKEVFTYIGLLNTDLGDVFVYDPFIVRWLDYYTGTVFENLIEWDLGIGSICSGGRYANLTQSIEPKSQRFDWVGWSIGLSRLFFLVLEKNTEKAGKMASTDILLLHFEDTFEDIVTLSKKLQASGKRIEIYPSASKLKKQFSYADKLNIPEVVILWEWEKEQWIYKIKNMLTGEEREVALD